VEPNTDGRAVDTLVHGAPSCGALGEWRSSRRIGLRFEASRMPTGRHPPVPMRDGAVVVRTAVSRRCQAQVCQKRK